LWAVRDGATKRTSLDLVIDCFDLDQGLWEWKLDGPYAAEIGVANGRNGIPHLNIFGWIFLDVCCQVHAHNSLM
jgi:hypothetical protein